MTQRKAEGLSNEELTAVVGMRSFEHYCTCGGYVPPWMNGRDQEHPHMVWCAQHDEWEWHRACLAERNRRAARRVWGPSTEGR